MPRLIIRIRPQEVMEDLDLAVVQQRAEGLAEWHAEVVDTRLSDAPYVALVLDVPCVDDHLENELRRALAELPRMRASLYRRGQSEASIGTVDQRMLESALEPP
jgi:hypothetical protein